MRHFQPTRQSFIPKGSIKIVPKGLDVELYIYADREGRPCAVAFGGKRNKPDLHVRFRSPESREQALREHVENARKVQYHKSDRQSAHAETFVTLREVYYRRTEHPDIGQGVRKELTQTINQAAEHAGLNPDPSRNRADVYAEAAEVLDRKRPRRKESPFDYDIRGHVDHLCEQIRRGWEEAKGAKYVRVSRLPERLYRATFTLHRALDDDRPKLDPAAECKVTTSWERTQIERDVTTLCEALGINHSRTRYQDAISECFKRLGGDEHNHPLAKKLYELAETIDERIEKVRKAKNEETEESNPMRAAGKPAQVVSLDAWRQARASDMRQ